MSDQAATYLVSRLAVATVEFLIVGFLVAGLLALLPHIAPRWRRRIWFLALCKPFFTVATASLKGIVPLAPLVNGTLLGDILFPLSDTVETLSGGGTTSVLLYVFADTWIAVTALLLARLWVLGTASR